MSNILVPFFFWRVPATETRHGNAPADGTPDYFAPFSRTHAREPVIMPASKLVPGGHLRPSISRICKPITSRESPFPDVRHSRERTTHRRIASRPSETSPILPPNDGWPEVRLGRVSNVTTHPPLRSDTTWHARISAPGPAWRSVTKATCFPVQRFIGQGSPSGLPAGAGVGPRSRRTTGKPFQQPRRIPEDPRRLS